MDEVSYIREQDRTGGEGIRDSEIKDRRSVNEIEFEGEPQRINHGLRMKPKIIK